MNNDMKRLILLSAMALTAHLVSAQEDNQSTQPEYGRSVTRWASTPKFGGYAIGSYKYSDEDGRHGGDGFNARLLRLYVDGSLLTDFKYRVQLEVNGGDPGKMKSPHLKDFYLSWSHWKELEVKVGQFKRCFTFENPYNPWDVGAGDYSQVVKKLSGFNDLCGGEATNNGGRDLGLQLQGDLLPVGRDHHRLVHYQVAMMNGQGINQADANRRKDFLGTLQLQPLRDLYVGVFGWKGNMTYGGVTAQRNRYALCAKYEHDGWTARAEYAHHSGDGKRSDGWYLTAGIPCTSWLKVYAKYDAYRSTATNSSLQSIYSLCPNFQLHRNLMFQLQYNYVCSKPADDRRHNELWGQVYFRF